jgi:hypothetical protein
MIKEIPKSDVITRPFKVYKEWTLDENDINPIFGENGDNTLIDIDSDSKSHGFNKKVVHASIRAQFYTNAATSSLLTEVGRRKSYASADERVMDENEIAVFSIPQQYYGEGLKIGTLTLEDETTGKLYTDDHYSNLIDATGSIVGNIFYDRGLVVITKNVISGSVLNNFTLNFRSTKTIFENEVFISVLENEFNYSQNPTAVYEDGGSKITHIINRPGLSLTNASTETVTSSFYSPGVKYVRNKNFPFVSEIDSTKHGSFDDYLYSGSVDPTGSYLAPYITTIGLYDDELNMVAVAKLPRPIKSLPDYPLNFIVRFDT